MTGKVKTVDAYLARCTPEVAPLMQELRAYLHDALPGVTERMDYGVPTFLNARGVRVIYLYAGKAHVNVGFLRSAEIADPDGVLKGSGKPSKHIRVVPGKPVAYTVLAPLVAQCRDL